jgi:hypothetical protein
MGIFSYFDRTKEGPGVPADEPSRPPFVLFFIIFARKFWELIRTNLLHATLSLPAVALSFIISGMFFQILAERMGISTEMIQQALDLLRENPDNMLDLLNTTAIVINQLIIAGAVFLVCTGTVAIGPLQAGYAFLMRNFAREEHAFLWSDYWRVAKKNLRQGILVMIANLAIIFFFGLWFRSWYLFIADQWAGNVILRFAPAFMGLFLLIFLMMQIYLYQMMVTFDFKLWQLYKNAFLLAMAMFVPNLGIVAVTTLLVFSSMAINTLWGAFAYMLIVPSVCWYIMNFYAHRVIRKFLIMTAEQREAEDKQVKEEKEARKKAALSVRSSPAKKK